MRSSKSRMERMPSARVGIEGLREERDLAAKTREAGRGEIDLVEAVLRDVQSVGRGAEIDGGGDADDAAELWRRGGAEVAGEFQHEIAAHGVADKRDGLRPCEREEVAHDGVDIAGEAGVIERWREAPRCRRSCACSCG